MDEDVQHPLLTDAAAAVVRRAKAQFEDVQTMVRYRDAETIRIAALDSPMRRRVERSAIATALGQATGRSDHEVLDLLHMADTVVERAPKVWAAFREGQLDEARVRSIARTLAKLEREESHEQLDVQVLDWAPGRTVGELQAWLRRFVARVEADLAVERAETERSRRFVRVEQADDSMAWLTAYLPAHEAAGIMSRLRKQARTRRLEGDERTLEQLKADLLADWALGTPTSTDARPSGLVVDIGVMMEKTDLTNERPGLSEAADGTWEVPTSWILEAGAEGHTFWHRFITSPHDRDTFSHDYAGYAPPESLRRAIALRDGVCATPGCGTPAEQSELDHVVPWPLGPTAGHNLRYRCKRHHAQKGHLVLRAKDLRALRRLPPWPPAYDDSVGCASG